MPLTSLQSLGAITTGSYGDPNTPPPVVVVQSTPPSSGLLTYAAAAAMLWYAWRHGWLDGVIDDVKYYMGNAGKVGK